MRNAWVIVAVIVVGVIAYMALGRDSLKESTELNTGRSTSTQSDSVDVSDVEAGSEKYVVFTENAYAENSSKRRVLFFYANWCSTCQPAQQDILGGLDQLPDDAVVLRVNYNDSDADSVERELARKYGVTYQHTFVLIDESGEVVARWNGGGLDQILANLGEV